MGGTKAELSIQPFSVLLVCWLFPAGCFFLGLGVGARTKVEGYDDANDRCEIVYQSLGEGVDGIGRFAKEGDDRDHREVFDDYSSGNRGSHRLLVYQRRIAIRSLDTKQEEKGRDADAAKGYRKGGVATKEFRERDADEEDAGQA